MSTFKKIVAVIFLLGALFLAYMIFGSYGAGYRAGSLTKIATKGVVFKTNEGEMFIGTSIDNAYGETEAGGVINKIWYFSVVNDPELLSKLESALLNGQRVKLHYHQKYWKLFWVGDSKYVVDGVEVLESE